MEIGQQINVTIDAIAFGGDGVARTDEGVVFVPYSAIGDTGIIRITSVSKNFSRGEFIARNQDGVGRCEPVCPYYGQCGGCQYQHLDYETEFAAKRQQLVDVLTRLGKISALPELSIAFPAPQAYGYRNKLRLEAQPSTNPETGKRQVTYGYYKNDNKSFFRVKECPLAQDSLNRLILKAARSDWGQANSHRKGPKPKTYAPAAMTIRVTSAGETAFYFGFAPTRLTWLREELAGFEYAVPVGSFWQINPPVASALLENVAQWVAELPLKSLIDAYAGVGTFSCAMKNPFVERLLIEYDKGATAAAQTNLQNRGYACQIIADATEKALPKNLPKYQADSTLVILDPPRTGCQDVVLDSIIKNRPAAVLYVSCNAATLARDLRKLCSNENSPYQVTKLGIFDMFPRTAHFETAALLQLKA